VLARLPISPALMELADSGRVEEIDDPICDNLERLRALKRYIESDAAS
jgi:hypothetical protein